MELVKVSDYFEVKYGINLNYCEMKEDNNGINFVSRTSKNNGVCGKVKIIENFKPNPANTISVSCGGSVMESFLQKTPYYSGYHLFVLKPKQEFTDLELLYYCMCLRANKYRYNYGRQANKTLKDIKIPCKSSIPEWVYNIKLPKVPSKDSFINNKLNLQIQDWKYFKIFDLFDIKGTTTTSAHELKKLYGTGKYPYVTTKATNNGVEGYYNHYTEEDNVLTIDSATIGYCSYQEYKFSASDHVEKLLPKFNMNKYSALFLQTIINKEQPRYCYGRKFNQTRIKNTLIKLPADLKGHPDWQFMENYIKSLPYSSNLV